MLAREIERVLSALGDQLDAGAEVSLVLVGGAALALLGVVERATYDVDVIARADARGNLEPPSPSRAS